MDCGAYVGVYIPIGTCCTDNICCLCGPGKFQEFNNSKLAIIQFEIDRFRTRWEENWKKARSEEN